MLDDLTAFAGPRHKRKYENPDKLLVPGRRTVLETLPEDNAT